MSETAQRSSAVAGGPPGRRGNGNGTLGRLRGGGIFLMRQREATVFIVVVLLVVYFGFISSVGRSKIGRASCRERV